MTVGIADHTGLATSEIPSRALVEGVAPAEFFASARKIAPFACSGERVWHHGRVAVPTP